MELHSASSDPLHCMGECRIPVASISRLSPSTRTKVTLQFVRVEGESLEIEARLTVYNVLQQDSWEYHTQHDTYMYMHMYLYVQHVYTCIHTGTCICTRQSLNTVEYMYVHYRIHTLFVHVQCTYMRSMYIYMYMYMYMYSRCRETIL